jgi:hypothetical protein
MMIPLPFLTVSLVMLSTIRCFKMANTEADEFFEKNVRND